ncbi:hypothetical protein [Puniceicoccus vermicola]|uniref:SLATT domain-containing protein n=1 Tax=Puniceicoccus vermicola TaxID=388746 RepID=A0A7X1B032_9BACT|nr:hypothetical protein [Puniceicoccus vermicola]MBC2603158.1 hypothetical protein [Puniceicoccus vermicola]
MEKSLIDKELDELYKEVADGQERGEKVGSWRKIAAYSLKVVAAGGSLIVATGLLEPADQGIGIAVLLAIFADTISSNHKRLIAEVEAGYAFRALRSRVKGEFNREASPLYSAANTENESAVKELEQLKKRAHIALSDGIAEIRSKLEKSDIEALKALSLDQERSGLSGADPNA